MLYNSRSKVFPICYALLYAISLRSAIYLTGAMYIANLSTLDHLLGEVLLELKYIPLTQHHHPVCGNEMLTDILRFIEQHPNVPMDISSISERYFVSRSWLEHTFRNQMGMSVTQYIRVKKILYAQALIQNGLPPTLAAQYCSYDNYSTFYRNYKKILLHSPEQDLPQ